MPWRAACRLYSARPGVSNAEYMDLGLEWPSTRRARLRLKLGTEIMQRPGGR